MAPFRNYVPDISVRLTDSFRRSQLTLSYMNNVNPGNGLFLTSRTESFGGGYSYRGIRYWSFGVNGSYDRMSAMLQTIGKYGTYGGGWGVTRELGKGLHAVARMDYREFHVKADSYRHNQIRVSLGFTYSPGEMPLSLW